MKIYKFLALVLGLALLASACAPTPAENQVNNLALTEPAGGEGLPEATEPVLSQPTQTEPLSLPETAEPAGTESLPGTGGTLEATAAPPGGLPSTPTAELAVTPASEAITPTVGAEEPLQGVINNPTLASALLDFPIMNLDGQTIDQVNDIILDASDFSIDYVISDQGIVIPWEAFTQVNPDDDQFDILDQAFYLNVEDQILEQAPSVDLNALDLSDPAWRAEAAEYWQNALGAAGEAIESDTAEAAALSLNELLQTQVGTTGAGDALGQVVEAIVDPETGRVIYLALTGLIGTEFEGRLIPVPPNILEQATDAAQGLNLQIDPSVLAQAPSLSFEELTNLMSADWVRQLQEFWLAQPQ